jgi:hypothetical protein
MKLAQIERVLVFDIEFRRWNKEYITVTNEVDSSNPRDHLWVNKMKWDHRMSLVPSMLARGLSR